jgi:polysaccharide pyruvyl transferase WcaK-like protein
LIRTKRIYTVLIIFVLTIFLIGCQSADKEPFLYFKNDTGDILMTDLELKTLKVTSLIDGSRHVLYIVPKDKNKIKEITTKTLNKSINIYYKGDLIYSQKIAPQINESSNVFFSMDEETLKRLEQILKENQ